MPESSTSKPIVGQLEQLWQAESAISGVERAALWNTLYDACCRLVVVHAFYVCLYRAYDGQLHYPLNIDTSASGETFCDQPNTTTIGNGPASEVLRSGRLFLFDPEDPRSVAVQRGGVPYGDITRRSESALHVPIRAFSRSGEARVLGVLSVQSYDRHAYGLGAALVVQRLADCAGRVLQREQDEADWQAQLALENGVIQRVAEILQELNKQVDVLRGEVRNDGRIGLTLVEQIREAIWRHQTEVSDLLLRPITPDTAVGDAGAKHSRPALTRASKELLTFMMTSDAPMSVFADEQGITLDAAKSRAKRLYRDLGVRSRANAVKAGEALGLE